MHKPWTNIFDNWCFQYWGNHCTKGKKQHHKLFKYKRGQQNCEGYAFLASKRATTVLALHKSWPWCHQVLKFSKNSFQTIESMLTSFYNWWKKSNLFDIPKIKPSYSSTRVSWSWGQWNRNKHLYLYLQVSTKFHWCWPASSISRLQPDDCVVCFQRETVKQLQN